MRHPWRALQPVTRRRLLTRTGALFVILTVAMTRIGAPLKNATAPHGIVSFEFARTTEDVRRVLDGWTPEQKEIAGRSLRLDFTYILAYALAISLACAAIADASRERGRRFADAASLASWGALAAGALDVVENVALMSELGEGAFVGAPMVAYLAASLKFLLIGAAATSAVVGAIQLWSSRGRRAK